MPWLNSDSIGAVLGGAVVDLKLGCPVWACGDWRGSVFDERAKPADFLRQYAQIFPTVEGNSTFYALPKAASVRRWLEDTPAHFRFCFKFPMTITHRLQLRHAQAETAEFLHRMAPLRSRLGPLMLQLGPRFGPKSLDILDRFLRGLSTDFDYAVEVRHSAFFNDPLAEAALNQLLRQRGVDRVLFDSRCVHAAMATDASTREALARKPRLPLRVQSSGERPIVRFVGQNAVEPARDYLADWSGPVQSWLNQGKSVYFFTHTPDDRNAPGLAKAFEDMLTDAVPGLRRLPELRQTARQPVQASMFPEMHS